jgi:hypothetical protein
MAVSMEVAASFLPRAVGAMIMHYAILEHWFDGMVSTIRESVEGGMSIRRHHPFNAKDGREGTPERSIPSRAIVSLRRGRYRKASKHQAEKGASETFPGPSKGQAMTSTLQPFLATHSARQRVT